jgi:peroxin-4
MASRTRLLRELKAKSEEFELNPVGDNLNEWQAVITGPSDSPFDGGKFLINFKVPDTYPFTAPKVVFKTKIFHPNVHFDSGEICLDVLKSDWCPAWNLEAICRAISALMNSPNADSPLNCDAGNMIRAGDMRAYNSMAKMYTIEYAN